VSPVNSRVRRLNKLEWCTVQNLLNPIFLQYFFGSQFSIEAAVTTMNHYDDPISLAREIEYSIATNRPHTGLQLVGYQDIDTGQSLVIMVRNPNALSGVSFFAQSAHRLFGGSTLVHVPLVFCSSIYKPHGDYLVYRHTFKRPKFTDEEIRAKMESSDMHQKLQAFVYARSRDGYETIPGMSYVGITKRSWQDRYAEHVEMAMETPSSTKFHEAVRSMQGQRVIHVHDVSAFGITEKEARAYESHLISSSTLWPLGLNMRI
jgi:hypothetical protein